MTRYRGGLSKGDVIRANQLLNQKAAERQRIKLINAVPPPRDAGKRLMRHKKAMVARYKQVYGTNTHQCIWCGTWIHSEAADYTLEHLIPLSANGSNHPENHHPACLSCNHDKGQLLPDEWLNVLRRRYDESPGLNAPLVYMIMRVEFWLIYISKNKDRLFNK